MRRDMNEDKFLYDISEESILKDWNMGIEAPDHEFSEEYQKFRQEMLRKAGKPEDTEAKENGAVIPVSGRKKHFFKTPIGVAAAIAAVFLLSAGAYAISGIFQVKDRKQDDASGEIYYTIEAQEGIAVTPTYIKLGYVPEGYEEMKNGGNGTTVHKLHKADGSGGLTVGISDYSSGLNFPFVSSYEETEIGGIKADILRRDGTIEYNHIILLFYEELGQVVTIYGHRDISLDELKKIAENIQLEPTGEEAYVPEVNADGEKGKDTVEPDFSVEADQRIELGETIDIVSGITFTVKDIELKDNMNGLDEKYLSYNEDGYNQYLNEDGTFKDVELGYSTWENNAMVEKTQGTDQVKMAYVTMEVTNTSDEDVTDTFVWGRLGTIGEDNIFKLFADYSGILKGWSKAAFGEPFYYDGSDYADSANSNKHLFFSDFKAGETRTVHLAFAYVEQMEENAWIALRSWVGDKEPVYVKLVP